MGAHNWVAHGEPVPVDVDLVVDGFEVLLKRAVALAAGDAGQLDRFGRLPQWMTSPSPLPDALSEGLRERYEIVGSRADLDEAGALIEVEPDLVCSCLCSVQL